jgi:hypothetical protein
VFSIGGIEWVLDRRDRMCSPHPMPETRDHPGAHKVCGCAHKKPALSHAHGHTGAHTEMS